MIEQPADVTFVLDALMGDTWIDRERVAVAGFSLGALTVDGATFDRARRHRRIRAAIAMSGRLSPFGGGYEVAGVPLFAVHGVREDVAAYEQATPPVQGRGWTLAPRDSGPEAGVHSWKGH